MLCLNRRLQIAREHPSGRGSSRKLVNQYYMPVFYNIVVVFFENIARLDTRAYFREQGFVSLGVQITAEYFLRLIRALVRQISVARFLINVKAALIESRRFFIDFRRIAAFAHGNITRNHKRDSRFINKYTVRLVNNSKIQFFGEIRLFIEKNKTPQIVKARLFRRCVQNLTFV